LGHLNTYTGHRSDAKGRGDANFLGPAISVLSSMLQCSIPAHDKESPVTARRNPWFSLAMDAMRLGMEAQSVIGLRMAKAAWGGIAAQDEAERMVAEKAKAAVDAQMVFATSLLTGQGHLGPARAMALYRRRVQANQRRLLRGG
jgi:hypothetical protein